ncbi:MAG TPA: LamG-like jellyroll fold domain-containing protein, partial [Cytophagaceae bacterium]|nr:LamG-like jellyroll fold domain-containing protein [Cytophagaceae bacterium]
MIRQLFIIVFMIVLLPYASRGAESKLVQYQTKDSLSTSSVLSVIDPVIYKGIEDRQYKTQVKLLYGREQRSDLYSTASWSYQVTYTITFYDDSYTQVGSPLTGNTLTISSDNVNPVYQATHLFQNAGYNYGNVKLTVTNIINSSAPDDIRLELELTAQTNFLLTPTESFQLGRKNDMVYWSFIEGAEAYQLEWVFIDSMDQSGIATSTAAFAAKRGVRVQTTDQYYVMNMTLPSGTLYYRVRGIGKYLASTNTTLKYGQWIAGSPVSIAVNNDTLTDPVSFERNKNWQYVTSYAEDGKYKKVVTYYDGTLRNRQVSTNLSSDSTTLLAETKYDYEGRGVINILPIALQGNHLNYHVNLNNFSNGKTDYDNILTGSVMPGLDSTTSQACLYYSDQNTVENLHRDYLPKAGAYPFVATQYLRDGTGRVSRQSNVGEIFRLKDPDLGGHYTRYVYGNTNSTELHRLFGSNVGVSSHYKKNYVIDPNGQISVSYLDQEERVIATALAGDTPSNLNALTENSSQELLVNLSENNVMDNVNFVSHSTSKIVNAKSTNYTLLYDLTGVINNAGGFFDTCRACAYDLVITVKGPDGIELTPTSPIVRNNIHPSSYSCSDSTYNQSLVNETFTFNKIGEYTIEKKLTLNSGAIALLLSQMQSQGGYPDSSEFVDDELALVDSSKCDLTCEDHCYTKIFNDHPTWAAHPTTYADSISNALAACLKSGPCTDIIDSTINDYDECESMRRNMLEQLYPGGYYNSKTGWLEDNYSSITFLDANGAPITTGLPGILRDSLQFRDDWAEALLSHHPEYCHLARCALEADSRKFDLNMARVADWNEAVTDGYIDPLGGSVIDPMFNSSTTPYGLASWGTAIEDTIQHYMVRKGLGSEVPEVGDKNSNGTAGDLWDLASSYMPYSYDNSYIPSAQEKWLMFRSVYQGMKEYAVVYGHENYGSGCAYLEDSDNTVVEKPLLSTDITTLTGMAHDNLINTCLSGCDENVKVWMTLLQNKCAVNPDTTFMSSGDSSTVATALSNYCAEKCGSANPFGLLLKTDLDAADSFLVAAQTVLSGYGCSLYTIAVENPYQVACNDKGEDGPRRLTPCAFQTIKAINDFLTGIYSNTTLPSGCPDSTSWSPGQIAQNPYPPYGIIYSSIYENTGYCNSVNCPGYKYFVMLYDHRTINLDRVHLQFLWSANSGSVNYYGGCFPESIYLLPNYCVANEVYQINFFDPTTGLDMNLDSIVSVFNPRIDFSYSYGGYTWDDNTFHGVMVDAYVHNGTGSPVLMSLYVNATYTNYLTWKTDRIVYDEPCVMSGFNTCPSDMNDEANERSYSGIHMNGSSDYIDVPGFTWPKEKDDITVEFWIKVDSAEVGSHCVFSIGNSNTISERIQAHIPWSDKLLYWHYASADFTTDYTCYLDKWTHVALVSDGKNGHFRGVYLDGELVRYDTISYGVELDLSGLTIGSLISSYFHNGMIRDFRIWDKVRSGFEINRDMNVNLASGTHNLVGYWKLNEGSGSTAYDGSGYGHNGTLHGCTWTSQTGMVGRTTDPGTGHYSSCVEELPGRNELCNASFTINWSTLRDSCIKQQRELAIHQGTEKWKLALDTFQQNFLAAHFNKCFGKLLNEQLRYEYTNNEYHYTLYYY